jgi:methyl-accepting chemotaxis protein
MEGRRTTDIEQIVAGWDKSSEAMTKVCEETRQAVLQVHLSVKETTSALQQTHQSNKHDHELMRESIKELANEQRLRSAQHTPVHSPAYRDE